MRKLTAVGHFWKMRSGKRARMLGRPRFQARKKNTVPTLRARWSICAGLQPTVTRRIGTAARRKALLGFRSYEVCKIKIAKLKSQREGMVFRSYEDVAQKRRIREKEGGSSERKWVKTK